MPTSPEILPRAAIGIPGLDDILSGGLARNRLHLLEGSPGTGKTTIALQFLMAGAEAGEIGIYVSLAETEHELRAGARSHGWEIDDKVAIVELLEPESVLDPEQHQSLLYSSDLELGETIQRIVEAIEDLKPKRVVIDSLSEIRLLAQSSLRYRRQILALKHYFARYNSTVVLLDDMTTESIGSGGSQHGAQRDPPGSTGAELWRRAAAAACDQMPRPELSRRLSRLHHRDRRRAGISASGRGGAPAAASRQCLITAAWPDSTGCLAAALPAAPAPWCWVRPAPASR